MRLRLLAAALAAFLVSNGAAADPTGSIDIVPAPGPAAECFSPGVRVAADLGLVVE